LWAERPSEEEASRRDPDPAVLACAPGLEAEDLAAGHPVTSPRRVPPAGAPPVSVIMAARDAEATIAEALGSLRGQTMTGWEAVVVDDGSTDGTAGVVAGLGAADARIRLLSGGRRGVSAARNAGLGAARGKFVLFLDADDLLEPRALERLSEALLGDPSLAAAHGIWSRVSGDGERVLTEELGPAGDLFQAFACRCAFAIHACLVRRELIERAGGFDPSLTICVDWDLWQRIARGGARFGTVAERVARYRTRPGSTSFDGARLFAAGSRLIDRAHRPDPRARDVHPEHIAGRPAPEAQAAKLHLASWCAGLEIGRGEDGRALLGRPSAGAVPGLDVEVVVTGLLTGLAVAREQPPATWGPEDHVATRRVREFIEALEVHAATPGLARQAGRLLDRRLLRTRRPARPVTVGRLFAVQVDVASGLIDVTPPAAAERIDCEVGFGDERLGAVELPVCDGLVPAELIIDAIVAKFWWDLLGRFFAATLYPALLVADGTDGWSMRRGELMLASQPPSGPAAALASAHDVAGWAVLLQELWNRPDWPAERFYVEEAEVRDEERVTRDAVDGWVVVEASDEPFDVEAEGPLDAVLTVGGAAVGSTRLPGPPAGGTVRAGVLRSALITASGAELCRVAVREGVLGRPLTAPGTLRERLAEAAAVRRAEDGVARADGTPAGAAEDRPTRVPARNADGLGRSWPAGAEPGPGWSAAIRRARAGRAPALLLARRFAPIGTSASRRAALPAAAAPELAAAAVAAGEPALQVPAPGRAAYVPELLWRPGREPEPARPPAAGGDGAVAGPRTRGADRHVFEALFARRADPWRYESRYEREKYEQTLGLLPRRPIRRALEIGCAEGHFTVRLAPRVDLLVAADISRIALERAAARCRGLAGVSFLPLDVATEAPPGLFDLIVCSEVLYYVGGREELEACTGRLAEALEPGGHLLSAHANLLSDDPDEPGFAWGEPFGAKTIGEALAATPALQPLHELRTPYYRIHLLQRKGNLRAIPRLGRRTWRVREADAAPPPPEVAVDFRPQGGRPPAATEPEAIATRRLPILAYHRVAADGPSALARFRVAPPAFEEQLDYLSEAGFGTVSLDQWHAAAEAHRPLPGRAVILTFDAGYRDFLTHAWPALRQRGFTAMVFLVTDEVGRTSRWDASFGEPVPLLDWDEVITLQAQGVKFGSHTATHRPLTSLAPAEAARELARSRRALQERLGRPADTIAYPHGDADPATTHLAGACGFTFGLTCQPRACRFNDPLLELPRIEVPATMSLSEFIAALG
jgi:peptidoglycan/xylan/chitin deacetylase (PgdA/CDA1 family)/SAM-dependent methyltransferase/GT2 family glycosyltransferase